MEDRASMGMREGESEKQREGYNRIRGEGWKGEVGGRENKFPLVRSLNICIGQ